MPLQRIVRVNKQLKEFWDFLFGNWVVSQSETTKVNPTKLLWFPLPNGNEGTDWKMEEVK